MSKEPNPNIYSSDGGRVYLQLADQLPSQDLPARIKVMPTALGRKELNAFWPYWLRRNLLLARYRSPMAVELHGKYVLVSADEPLDRLRDWVRTQAQRICPLTAALEWRESGGRHVLEWYVPTIDAYKAIKSGLPDTLPDLPPSIKLSLNPPYGPGKHRAILWATNTKPGTKVSMAEVRQRVELEAALLYAA